jgi:hypothetical protein
MLAEVAARLYRVTPQSNVDEGGDHETIALRSRNCGRNISPRRAGARAEVSLVRAI